MIKVRTTTLGILGISNYKWTDDSRVFGAETIGTVWLLETGEWIFRTWDKGVPYTIKPFWDTKRRKFRIMSY